MMNFSKDLLSLCFGGPLWQGLEPALAALGVEVNDQLSPLFCHTPFNSPPFLDNLIISFSPF